MRYQYPDSVRARAVELMRRGTAQQAIDALRADGVSPLPTPSCLSRWLAAAQRDTTRAAIAAIDRGPPPRPEDASTIDSSTLPSPDASIGDNLRAAYAQAQARASRALAVDDSVQAKRYSDIALNISAELRRLSHDGADPDDAIRGEDIRTAARRGRERLAQAIEKAAAWRNEWPKCPTCGAPHRPDSYRDDSPMWTIAEAIAALAEPTSR